MEEEDTLEYSVYEDTRGNMAASECSEGEEGNNERWVLARLFIEVLLLLWTVIFFPTISNEASLVCL